MFCDNTSAINLSKNPNRQTKYIDIRHQFLKYHVQKGVINLELVSTKNQLPEKKSLPPTRFFKIRKDLVFGTCPINNLCVILMTLMVIALFFENHVLYLMFFMVRHKIDL